MFRFFMKHFYSSFSGIFGVILSLGALVLLLFSLGKSEPFQILLLLILASLFTILQPAQFFMKAYGEKVLKERPWHVTDMGDSYAVTGSLEKGFFGGVAQLKIMKENGAVVLHLHGK